MGGSGILCCCVVAVVGCLCLKKEKKKAQASKPPDAAVATPVAVATPMGAGPVVGVAKKNPISLKLEELGCGQYEAALADQGWDNLASMQGLTKEEAAAIADEVKMKPGHKRRFVDGIAVRGTEMSYQLHA